ncbi:ABC transporter permease [Amycolatopsis sp. K13G38]|uniref:ABC transporter permease n=1 Tax=Amycolatopsis acididurans TaxID=2724524 RepID=A0ABX1IWR9_9PSEU|nr:ABC transporter permease [Amycolatopsis acididurans]NKQ51945.1 ABC transporter permease [Amycolatopsis acididurans]
MTARSTTSALPGQSSVDTDFLPSTSTFARLMTPLGGFFAMAIEAFRVMFKRPLQWREFVQQTWFIARVSIGPAIFVGIPLTCLVTFQFNQVLREVGAIDLSGSGAALATVTQIGPVVATLVVAGAGATAICADLGARTIREEIDAMQVLGINVVHRLVSPRVLASVFTAAILNALIILIGLAGGFVFSVYVQGASPALYVSGLNLLVGVPDLIQSECKAIVFGMLAGLVGCYRGISVKGGPKAVGNAVNETVVYSFMMLFVANLFLTALPYNLGLVGK